MSKRILTIGFCIIMIIIAIIMMVIALGFAPKTAGTFMPGSRFFPMITLGLIIFFSLGIIGQNISKKDSENEEEKVVLEKPEIIRVVIVTIAGFLSYVIWNKFGFMAISAFLIVVIGITLRIRSLWGYAILAAIAAALYFGLKSLGIPLN